MNPTILFFILYFALLFGGIGFLELIRKRQDEERNIDHFTDDIGRPAGESLRVKIEGFQDSFNSYIMVFMFGVVGASITPLLNFPNPVRWMVLGIGLGAIVHALRKLKNLRTSLFNHRLGDQCEIVVGQHLNSLLAEGFEVFHDIIFTKGERSFNIDHVVVGPSGVFAVETKTRRKPKHLKGKEKAKVVFDGTHLAFPTFTDQHGIDQAILNAETLSQELTKSTGDTVRAKPVLTLPGWFVERTGRGELLVLNPKQLVSAVKGKRELEEDQIRRIRHQLQQRAVCD